MNSSVIYNMSDVVIEGCYPPYFDAIACTRNGTLTLLCAIFVALCIYRLSGYYRVEETVLSLHVFYLTSVLQFMCLGIHSMLYVDYKWFHVLEHCAQCLRLVQVLMLIHCYWCEANLFHPEQARARENFRRFTTFLCVCIIIEFIVLINYVTPITQDCQHWRQLTLSIIDLFGVVVLVPGIIKYVNLVPTFEADQELKARWIRQSIIVLSVYLASSLAWFLYCLILYCLSREGERCADIFMSNQVIYTTVYACYIVVLFMVPYLTIFIVFYPEARQMERRASATRFINDYGTV